MSNTPPNTLGDGPIEEEYLKTMNRLAHILDAVFNSDLRNRKTGFILMTFAFGDKGRCNYISNCNRDDVKVLLREQLARFEEPPNSSSSW